MAQTAAEGFCRVLHEAEGAADDFEASATKQFRWAAPPWAWETTPSDMRMGRRIVCASIASKRGDGLRFCFVGSGTLLSYVGEGKTAATVDGALRRLIAYNLTSSEDYMLINQGSWYLNHMQTNCRGVDCDEAQASTAAALVHLARTQPHCPHILWRETFATHFPTTSGLFDRPAHDALALWHKTQGRAGSNASAGLTCQPYGKPNAQKPAVLANVSAILATEPRRITLLDAWSLTRDMSALHPQHGTVDVRPRHDAHRRARASDESNPL